jgi:hypothetical protein
LQHTLDVRSLSVVQKQQILITNYICRSEGEA